MRWGVLVAVVAVLGILVGGGYLVKGCLEKREQQPVNQPTDEQSSPGEIKETIGS